MAVCIRMVVAAVILVGLIVGPIYLAVSAREGSSPREAACAVGDIACELGIPNQRSGL